MNKEFLDNIENTKDELERLKDRLKAIEKKSKIAIADSVQASSDTFPYTKHSTVIYGIPYNPILKNKYKKMIKSKQYKLDKMRIQLEYELNYIKDSEIRDIIRYRYNDNKTWVQIMFLMNYKSEEKARIKLKRFLEKN